MLIAEKMNRYNTLNLDFKKSINGLLSNVQN